MLKNNTRNDWTQLLIGREGTLGVITQVVISLQTKPQGLQTALCAVSGFEDALAVLSGFQRAHVGRLLGFEAMWRECITVDTRVCGRPAPFEAEHDVTLLLVAYIREYPGGTPIFSTILGDFYVLNL